MADWSSQADWSLDSDWSSISPDWAANSDWANNADWAGIADYDYRPLAWLVDLRAGNFVDLGANTPLVWSRGFLPLAPNPTDFTPDRPFVWLWAGDRLAIEDLGDGFALGDGFVHLRGSVAAEGASELASTPSGVATVTGTLTAEAGAIDLAGTPSGVATVAATLTAITKLAGSSDGVATVTGSLTAESFNELAGTPAGTSTVSGAISQVHDLASTPSGVATVTATLFQTNELTATSAGTSTVIGALTPVTELVDWPIPYQLGYGGATVQELQGTSAGGSSVTIDTPEIEVQLSGTSAGSSTVTSINVPYDHWWKLDETSVSNGDPGLDIGLQAAAGNPATITYLNNPDMSVAGVDNTGMDTNSAGLNGFGARVLDTTFFQRDVFSMGCWIKATKAELAAEDAQFIYDTADEFPDKAWYLYYARSSDVLQWRLRGPEVILSVSNFSSVYGDLGWIHVAGTHDNTTGQTILYINGVEYTSNDAGGPSAAIVYDTNRVSFGIHNESARVRHWHGMVDEYFYHYSVLTPAEIAEIADNPRIGTTSQRTFENIPLLDFEQINGQATVTASLDNGELDGDGDFIVELAGTIAGSASVTQDWFFLTEDPPNLTYSPPTTLYLWANTGVAFESEENLDDASGLTGFVSQTYPDGDVVNDFDRTQYLWENIGVAFEDYDDASGDTGFVSQTYPDGDLTTDFDRFNYHYLNVIKEIGDGLGRLTVRPGRNDRKSFVPSPRPPSGKLS